MIPLLLSLIALDYRLCTPDYRLLPVFPSRTAAAAAASDASDGALASSLRPAAPLGVNCAGGRCPFSLPSVPTRRPRR